jgi:hypothetical protein
MRCIREPSLIRNMALDRIPEHIRRDFCTCWPPPRRPASQVLIRATKNILQFWETQANAINDA